MNYIANKRLFLTADQKRVVAVQSPEAGYLFRGAGQVVTEAEAARYNLVGTDLVRPVVAPATTEVEGAQKPENKAVLIPPTSKPAATKPAKKAAKK